MKSIDITLSERDAEVLCAALNCYALVQRRFPELLMATDATSQSGREAKAAPAIALADLISDGMWPDDDEQVGQDD